jgi:transcriptional antiterminator RfaH
MQIEDWSFAHQCGWGVVNTQPHRERIAVDNLTRQEFQPYCPLVRRRIRHARRAYDVLKPLFPGYLFVWLDPTMRWRAILSTNGVTTLVRCGEQPSLAPHGFVEALQSREIEGVIVRPESSYKVGQPVRIACGPFDGLAATIIAMDDEHDRLVVLVNLLNRSVNVKVPIHQVVPV